MSVFESQEVNLAQLWYRRHSQLLAAHTSSVEKVTPVMCKGVQAYFTVHIMSYLTKWDKLTHLQSSGENEEQELAARAK